MESKDITDNNIVKRKNYTIERNEFSDLQYYKYDYYTKFTAGDVVKCLLEKKLEVMVYWEDNGDVGMKDGGSCNGQEFTYPAMSMPWGGCFYEIQFMYHNQKYCITTFQEEDDSSSNKFSVSVRNGIADAELFPKLMGWENI